MSYRLALQVIGGAGILLGLIRFYAFELAYLTNRLPNQYDTAESLIVDVLLLLIRPLLEGIMLTMIGMFLVYLSFQVSRQDDSENKSGVDRKEINKQ